MQHNGTNLCCYAQELMQDPEREKIEEKKPNSITRETHPQ